MGFPVVDDHRQAGFPGQVQLADQEFLLQAMGRVLVIVIIQADLPDGHHPGIRAPCFDLVQVLQGAVADLFRMDPHRRPHKGVLVGQAEGHFGAGNVTAGINDPGHGLSDCPEQLFPVSVEILHVHMGMGIEQRKFFHIISPCCRRRSPALPPVSGSPARLKRPGASLWIPHPGAWRASGWQ